MAGTPELRIERFQTDLRAMTCNDVVQKHIIMGDCYVLDIDQHYKLQAAVSTYFRLHPSEVVVVGSAKLGFSVARWKRYRPFCDESDIDLALVSSNLFDKVWQEVFEYWDEVGEGEYWSKAAGFKEYLFRGWIRPDMLPPISSFPRRKEWFEFFRKLTSSRDFGPYKISAGIYKSLYHLERYQQICVRECQQELGVS